MALGAVGCGDGASNGSAEARFGATTGAGSVAEHFCTNHEGLNGAVSVLDKGKTAREVMNGKTGAGLLEKHFGVDPDLFREAVDSGVIELRKNVSSGAKLSPDDTLTDDTHSISFQIAVGC